MRKWLLILAAVVGPAIAMAQAKASETTIEYQRKKYQAATIEVPYPSSVVEDAIEEHMAKKGSPGSAAKDYRLYRNVNLGGASVDAYVKVDRKSRREKEATVVYIVTGHPNETITSRTANDSYGVDEARNYLNDLVVEIEAFNLGLNISKQDESVKTAEKKLNTLLADSTDLSKKKFDLDDKISKNSISIQNQKLEIEKQRQIMEALKGKRKTP